MRLEDEGSSGSLGSHWERIVLENEFMTASGISGDAAISNFTLKLLDDSGWYQVNYSKVDPIFWGKGRGCNFFSKACNASENTNFTEFAPDQ